jgi:hypothetical protein
MPACLAVPRSALDPLGGPAPLAKPPLEVALADSRRRRQALTDLGGTVIGRAKPEAHRELELLVAEEAVLAHRRDRTPAQLRCHP